VLRLERSNERHLGVLKKIEIGDIEEKTLLVLVLVRIEIIGDQTHPIGVEALAGNIAPDERRMSPIVASHLAPILLRATAAEIVAGVEVEIVLPIRRRSIGEEKVLEDEGSERDLRRGNESPNTNENRKRRKRKSATSEKGVMQPLPLMMIAMLRMCVEV
jgi:hypothetical protein